MKKRFLTVLLCGVLAASAVACGKNEENSSETTSTDNEIQYTASDYVKLGEYKGMEVTLSGDYEYTDEGFDSYLENYIQQQGIFIEDESLTTVEEDSIVNVDYVGSQDGVAFDGGSAEDQMLDIANNSAAGGSTGYIPGFTSGLVGYSVGDEVAYEVTFPDEYGNEDLAGQTVIFTFHINYIAKTIDSADKLTDDIIAQYFPSYATVDDFISAMTDNYKKMLEQSLESDKETAVLNALNNIATVSEVPEDLLQARVDLMLGVYENQIKSYNMTLEEYAQTMGMTYDDLVSTIKENMKEATKSEIILEAIADKENITVDDGYDAWIINIYSQMGYTDIDEFYNDYSVDGYDGKRYFQLAYRTEKATDFLVENCVVSFADPEDLVEDEADADTDVKEDTAADSAE